MQQPPKDRDVFLHAIATRAPPNSYTQAFTLDFLLGLQGQTPRKRQIIEKLYTDTGIEKRHTVIDDYGKPPEEYTFFPKSADLKPEPETWFRNYVAFPAMKPARDICLAHEDATVLIVGVELCSLHFQQKFNPEILVANAVFADGAAAALVSACPSVVDGPTLRLDSFAAYLWTTFFVLKAILEGDVAGRIFAAAFGPGLTVESDLLTKVGAT